MNGIHIIIIIYIQSYSTKELNAVLGICFSQLSEYDIVCILYRTFVFIILIVCECIYKKKHTIITLFCSDK